jgi:hypothetical protein
MFLFTIPFKLIFYSMSAWWSPFEFNFNKGSSSPNISYLPFPYYLLYTIFILITFFFSLSRIFNSFVAMDSFYTSCAETDLPTLHYVTFIEPFGVLPLEATSFDTQQFMNNYAKKVFE